MQIAIHDVTKDLHWVVLASLSNIHTHKTTTTNTAVWILTSLHGYLLHRKGAWEVWGRVSCLVFSMAPETRLDVAQVHWILSTFVKWSCLAQYFFSNNKNFKKEAFFTLGWKRNEWLRHIIWIKPRIIMLSDRSQAKKKVHAIWSHFYNKMENVS